MAMGNLIHNGSPVWERRSQLIAYVLLVLVLLFGFWRIEDTASAVKDETQESVYRQCNTVNVNRLAIRDILTAVAVQSEQRRNFIVNNPSTSATERQVAEEALQRTQEFVNDALHKMPVLACKKFPHKQSYHQLPTIPERTTISVP